MNEVMPQSLGEVAPVLAELGIQYGLRILAALVILVAVWFLSAWLANAVASVLRRTHADGTVTAFARTATRWAFVVLGVLVCMSIFGVELTSIAALLGGAGVAIGVALKGNLSNLASGMVLLAFRPFEEGQWVKIGDREGMLRRVGLLHTEIDAFDNARHWIPNADVIENPLTNFEYHAYRRADVVVGVAYDTDLDHAIEVLRSVAEDATDPQAPRGPVVVGIGFGASSIDFKVGSWSKTSDVVAFRTRLMVRIKRALDEADISIPFPQRDLHIVPPLPAVELSEDVQAAK